MSNGRHDLWEAAERSRQARLRTFIANVDSAPVRLFDRRHRASPGDWFGEHVGKWLCAATLASKRSQDDELADRIIGVADWLCTQQDPDGYLGTYGADSPARMTAATPDQRSWDLWIAACMMLGLEQAGVAWGRTDWVEAAQGIGAFISRTFMTRSVCDQGNHQGLSSAVVLEPLARLQARGGGFEVVLERIVDELESRLGLVTGPLAGRDAAELGTGKIYQLAWVYHGLSLASDVLQEPAWRSAAKAFWENVAEHHLTPMGGPWGGVAGHKEVFNPKGFFCPYGLVETCSILAWMRLSAELWRATGQERYGRAVVVSATNQLLGAAFPNGEDWSYFTLANGPRSVAYDWACCKSSGAWALEEGVAFLDEFSPSGATCDLTVRRAVRHLAHHEHEVLRCEYFALQLGEDVFAMEPLDGFQFESTLRLPVLFASRYVEQEDGALVLRAPGHAPIPFVPYRRAGLKRADRWRITWVPVVWQ